MQILIWAGAGLTLIGLLGLVWFIFMAAAIRRENLPDDALRSRLARLIPINLASLLLSVLGLMIVVVGLVLG